MWKASGVIGEGSDSFPIVEEIEAKKRGIRCAVYSKLLKLTLMILGKAVTSFYIAKIHIAGDTKIISVLDCFSCAYFTTSSQVKFLHGVS